MRRYAVIAATLALLAGCAAPYSSMTPTEKSATDIEDARRILSQSSRDPIDAIGDLARAVERPGGTAQVQRAFLEDASLKTRAIAAARDYRIDAHSPSWHIRHAHDLWVLSDTVLPEVRGDAQRIESIAIEEIRSGKLEISLYVDVEKVRAFADPNVKFDALVRNLVNSKTPNPYLAEVVATMGGVIADHPATRWLDENLTRRSWSPAEIIALRPLRIASIDAMADAIEAPATGAAAAFAANAVEKARAGLKDPFSARFRNVYLSDSQIGPMVCGELNAKNSYGAYVGFRRFFSNGVLIEHDDSKDLRSHFDTGWRDYCSQQVASVPVQEAD